MTDTKDETTPLLHKLDESTNSFVHLPTRPQRIPQTTQYPPTTSDSNETCEKSDAYTPFSSLWGPKLYVIIAVILLFSILLVVFFAVGNSNQFKKAVNSKNNKFSHEDIEWVNLETPVDIPNSWKHSRYLHDHEDIEISLAIKHDNVKPLENKLLELSNPLHKNYGKFLTYEEIHDTIRPSDKSIQIVKDWLRYYDIQEKDEIYHTPNWDFVKFKTSVHVANKMFNTKYSQWHNSKLDKDFIRVENHYEIPDVLKDHLDFISPSIRFPLNGHMKFMAKFDKDPSSITAGSTNDDDGNVWEEFDDTIYNFPQKLRSLYRVSEPDTRHNDTLQCVASFLEEWYNDEDLSTFWSDFAVMDSYVWRFPSYEPQGDGSEAELDVEYITSMGEGIQTVVWDIEDDNYFLSLLQQIETYDIIPNIVSMSYGGDEQSNGEEYCTRGNIEFGKVSAMGTTFFASSGDSGSISDDGNELDMDGQYTPSFPASSNYVLGVGGTIGGNIVNNSNETTNETAWYYSGGGFSFFFNRKPFQVAAQEFYLQDSSASDKLPLSIRYNALGSGYPDIAAQSTEFIIAYEDGLWTVSGTSCSCPTVAGMFSLIVNERLLAGKSSLGWLNPIIWLLGYQNQDYYYNDVTIGYNEGCDADDDIAFYAANGWDPISGWGTPKWDNLYDALINIEETTQEIAKNNPMIMEQFWN